MKLHVANHQLHLINRFKSFLSIFIFTFFLFSFNSVKAGDFDIALTKSTIAVGPLKYGAVVPMNITIQNQGDSTIQNIVIIDYVPDGFEFMGFINPGWTFDVDVANGVTFTSVNPLGAGQSRIITLNLIVRPGDSEDDWDNYAEVVSYQNTSGQQREGQDMDSTADKIYNNDGGAGAGSPSDNYLFGIGGGVFGDGVALTDEDDHDIERIRVVDFALRNTLLTPPGYGYGDDLVFEITIFNQGNETSGDVFIIDYIPEGYIYDPVFNGANGWLGTGTPGFKFSNIPPGGSATTTITLELVMEMFDGQAWDNYVEVFSITDQNNNNVSLFEADSTPNSDSDYENDVTPGSAFDDEINGNGQNVGEDEDDHDPAAPVIYDLAILKSRLTAVPSYSYGQEIEYFVEVFNQGNMPVKNVTVSDTIACGFEFDQDLNPDWVYDEINNKLTYLFEDPLNPTESEVAILNLIAQPCYDDPENAWTNYAEISSAFDINDNPIGDIDGVFDDDFTNDPGGEADSENDDKLDGNGIIDEDNHDSEKVEIVDLALKKVIKTQGPYVVGQNIDFTIKVYNQGNVIQKDIKIIDYIPAGFSYVSGFNNPLGWVLGSGSAIKNFPDRLHPGDSTMVDIRLLYLPNGQEPKDYFNYAHVYISQDTLDNNRFDDADSNPFTETAAERSVEPGDPDDDNIFALGLNFDEDQDDHDPAGFNFFDLQLTKEITAIPQDYTYGDEVTFTITIENMGTKDATYVEITDYLPCGFSLAPSNTEWTTDPMTGYLVHQKIVDIAPQDSYSKNLILIIEECTDNSIVDPWLNVAEISDALDNNGLPGDDQDSTPDNIPDNDLDGEDDIDDAGIIVNDLSLVKDLVTQGEIRYGDIVRFNLTISNEGNQIENNIVITDYLPCGYEFVQNGFNSDWVFNPQNGFYQYTILTPLAPGAQTIVSFDLLVVQCDEGGEDNYRNGAEISSGVDIDSDPDDTPGDPDDEDDSDDEDIEIYDLSLVKEIAQLGDVAYGESVTFNIIVTNEGNVPASNITIVDYMPCGYLFNSIPANNGWVVDGNTGYLNYFANTTILPGDKLVVPITLEFQECQNGGIDNYRNGAEIKDSDEDVDSTPDDTPGDPDDEDDSDDVDIPVHDLSLEKVLVTNGDIEYGQQIRFDIIVTNEGNQIENNILITDYLPCGFEFVNTSINNGWNFNNQNGYYDYTITNALNPGSQATVSLYLVVQECPNGGGVSNYYNEAEISSGEDVDSDPDDTPGDPEDEDDNDSEDLDIYDLSLVKEIAQLGVVGYGESVTFNIIVTNEGNVPASNITIVDYMPCGYVFNNIPANTGWVVDNNTGYLNYFANATILPGAQLVVPITLEFQQCNSGGEDNYRNKAEIKDSDDDIDSTPNDDPEDDLDGEDDIDDIDIDVFDLSLMKSVNTSISYFPGDLAVFTITVTNEGNVTANTYSVIDHLDCGFLFSNIPANNGWMTTLNGTAVKYEVNTPLAPGQSRSVQLTLMIEQCQSDDSYINYAEILDDSDDNGDDVTDVDSTPDDNPGNDSDGEDDNDEVEIDVVTDVADLTGVVWIDEDVDGLNDNNEPRVEDVVVQLYRCNGQFVNSTTTNSDGEYIFTNLPSGSYKIRFIINGLPQEYDFTAKDVGNNDSIDSDANTSGRTDCFDYIASIGKDDVDAGLLLLGSIGDYVWHDTNGNGVQDSNEQGIPDAVVSLYNAFGIKVGMTTTNASGYYQINNVSQGQYYLLFQPSAEYEATIGNIGNDNKDSDITGGFGLNTTDLFFVNAGQHITNLDGGFFECLNVCGTAWYDVNENDIMNSTENGINGLEVNLWKFQNGIWVKWKTTETDHKPNTPSDDGYFEFCTAPGTYYVEVILPPYGLVEAIPFVGGINVDSDITGNNGPGTTNTFTIINGQSKCNLGAGYYPMATVGNLVWQDDNGNGVQEPFEPKLAGVMVEAFDVNHVKIAETYTDDNGAYMIDYLQKQDYYLKFSAPELLAATIPNNSDEDTDSDIDHSNGLNTTQLISFNPGDDIINIDGGFSFGVLPLQWLDINAENKGDKHYISWQVTSEKNVDFYHVERSINNLTDFSLIAKVDYKSSLDNINTYATEDRDVELNGVYYYRVKQSDLDGKYSYSDVVKVNRSETREISVYPNPSTDRFNLLSSNEDIDICNIDVYDTTGKLVKSFKNHAIVQDFDVSDLQAGKYQLRISIDNVEYNQKLIIIK